ncbi:MAG TPA: tetratricopeptide repeat protein, partial [Pyrinomonadaceae bacterium]
EPSSYVKSKTKKKWWLFGLLGLIILTSALFAYRYLTPNNKQIESIAVLPFENASGNADLDYLSDGMSESVIDRLSQLGQLKVIARSSSFRYRGQNLDLKEIANSLGVQAIVTGRVVPRGDSYQIRVELIVVRENKQLWGENFTRKISDVQLLQTDISREIAENLRFRLSGTQTQQLAGQGTTNPQAYELRLKGRYYFYKTGTENYHKAVEYYEQAIALDPNYALAYAELADAYAFGGGRGLTRDERRAKVESAARKALELNANLAEAHFAMAQWKIDNWEWTEGERESKRAIELNPNLAKAYSGYARYLSLMGRHDEAIAAAKRGLELSPLTLINNWIVGDTYTRARQIDKAIEAYKNLVELDKNASVGHWKLGDGYAAKGMYSEAINEYHEAIRLRGSGDLIFIGVTDIEAVLGAAYAVSGERAKAEEILQKLKDKSRNEIAPRSLAILYAALGMRDEAFAQLEKAFAEHSSNLPFIAVEPIYDNLRDDPRFADLLRRMNLPIR